MHFCLLLCHSEPSYQDNPIKGFKPVQKSEIHFLHIGNDGLRTDLQPRKKAINLWENIEQQAVQILAMEKIQKREELWATITNPHDITPKKLVFLLFYCFKTIEIEYWKHFKLNKNETKRESIYGFIISLMSSSEFVRFHSPPNRKYEKFLSTKVIGWIIG